MKLRILPILLLISTVFCIPVTASSPMPDTIPDDRLLPRLVDDADLLTDREAAELLKALDEISERQEMDIVIHTTDAIPDFYSAQEYADDCFDYFGYGPDDDGILLLLSMEERDWAVSTYGFGINAYPDGIIDLIMDDCLYYISDGDYFGGFSTFAQLCGEYAEKAWNGYTDDGIYSGDYDYDDSMAIIGGADGPTEVTVSGGLPFALPISILTGFLISGLIVGVWKSELKTVGKKFGASDYAKQDSVRVTLSNDIFLYRTVNKTRKPTEQPRRSSGTGGSTVHRSSSGRSHGGRSGKF